MLSNESAISRETSFLHLAKSELDRRFGSVRKKKKAVRGHDALKRHRVRIKKLRYMAEFLKPLARKSIRTNLERAKAVTGSIGALNDAIAGERLLGQVVEEVRKPSVNFAADLIRARNHFGRRCNKGNQSSQKIADV